MFMYIFVCLAKSRLEMCSLPTWGVDMICNVGGGGA